MITETPRDLRPLTLCFLIIGFNALSFEGSGGMLRLMYFPALVSAALESGFLNALVWDSVHIGILPHIPDQTQTKETFISLALLFHRYGISLRMGL